MVCLSQFVSWLITIMKQSPLNMKFANLLFEHLRGGEDIKTEETHFFKCLKMLFENGSSVDRWSRSGRLSKLTTKESTNTVKAVLSIDKRSQRDREPKTTEMLGNQIMCNDSSKEDLWWSCVK